MKIMLHPEYGLYEHGGKPFCDSLQVAETFERRHDNILRDVQNVIEAAPSDFSLLKIEERNYKDRGRKYPKYFMTKDGFTLLVMGYTGKKAMQFKIAYINRFNQMETFIQNLATAKMEFPAFTNAVMLAHEEPKSYHYSNELDMINRIVLGVPAKKFKELNGIPKDTKSIRKYLSDRQTESIVALQRADIGLLVAVPDFQERKRVLTDYYNRLGQKQLTA